VAKRITLEEIELRERNQKMLFDRGPQADPGQ